MDVRRGIVVALLALGIIGGYNVITSTPAQAQRATTDRSAAHEERRFSLHHGGSVVKPKPKAKPKPKPRLPKHNRKPVRVADLSRAQTANAQAIADVGTAMHVSRRGQVVAIATALQESGLRVYANPAVPSSFAVPHQAVGYDHDSVGLFQQRVPMWGTAWQCMNPQNSARLFYRALLRIPGWQSMPVTVAAQSVQGSAFPDAYADDAARASWIRHELDRRY